MGVATRMTSLSDNIAISTGNIEHRNDVDMFVIDVMPNAVLNVVVDVAEVAPNLDVQVQVGLLFPDGVIELSSPLVDSILRLRTSVGGVQFPGEPSTAFIVVQSVNQLAGDIGTYTLRCQQDAVSYSPLATQATATIRLGDHELGNQPNRGHSRISPFQDLSLAEETRDYSPSRLVSKAGVSEDALTQEIKACVDMKKDNTEELPFKVIDQLMNGEMNWLTAECGSGLG